MIWQPEFTDKILSRKPGAVQRSEKEASCLQSEYSITVKSAGEEGNKRYFIASAPDKDQEWEC
ncbi:hypothetical protein ACF1UC_005213, partial [Escherichia coli]